MEFSVDVILRHSPEQAQEAFLDRDFLVRTGNLEPIGGAEVVELDRDATTARSRVRYRFTAPLSRAVTAVVDPAKLTWVDDGQFDLVALRSEHVLIPDHYADRLECTYTSLLAPDAAGTRWTVQGSLDVRAPLVGGRVAAVIVDGLRAHAGALGRAVDDWLDEIGGAPPAPS